MENNKKVIEVSNLGKLYQLGEVGTGTLSSDFTRWLYKIRGLEDPFLKIGETNDRSKKGNSDFVWALKDIDFSINQGEVVGFIGKNGAGKSTLLKVLSKITSPTIGSLKIKGRVASLLEVGTGFHPDLTGRENIYLNGAILGMKKKEIISKMDEIISFSGVERYIDTPVKRYSSGMYVRLAFAVAAHLDPEILIVDEVLAVGDAEFQEKCMGRMNKVAKDIGTTVLFVSHNMISVKNLCSRGIVLENGTQVFDGDQNSAVEYYLTKNRSGLAQNIDERTDREGTGEIVLSDVKLFEFQSNKSINAVISGQGVSLRFDFSIKTKIGERLFLGINILDSSENLVAFWASDEMSFDVNKMQNDGKVNLNIPQLLLRGGDYFIRVYLSKKMNNSAKHEIVDLISNAFRLNVLEGDYWSTGIVNRKRGSIIPGLFNYE